MNENISIVLADDHPLLLKGLKEFLIEKGFNVVGAGTNGSEAIELIGTHRPDLAILDIEMPHLTGLEVAAKSKLESPNTKIVLLSYHKEPEFILKAKELNIKGFIIKEDAAREVLDCIRLVLKGELYYSHELRSVDTKETDENVKMLASLTPSQLKIINHIAKGDSTKDIAETLCLSTRTIEKHRSNICSRLGLDGQSHQLNQWVFSVKHLLDS